MSSWRRANGETRCGTPYVDCDSMVLFIYDHCNKSVWILCMIDLVLGWMSMNMSGRNGWEKDEEELLNFSHDQ